MTEPAAPATPVTAPAIGSEQTAQPVRTLTVQLRPESLGLVTVRMSLREGALEIRMEAQQPQTAALLRADREAVQQVIRAAGAGADAVSVTVTDRSPQPAGNRSDAGFGPDLAQRDGSRDGSRDGEARTPGRDSGIASRSGHARTTEIMEDSDETAPDGPGARRRGLYL